MSCKGLILKQNLGFGHPHMLIDVWLIITIRIIVVIIGFWCLRCCTLLPVGMVFNILIDHRMHLFGLFLVYMIGHLFTF